MLVTMKEMLNHASDNNYAVMAVNCINMEILKAIITAAEEEKSPVIVNISPRQFKTHATLDYMIPMILENAKKATVPIALNLDHGQEIDDINRALNKGFSSIMFDGSTLSLEENIHRTSLIVSLANSMGKSVEAELGHVGLAREGDGSNVDFYTNVEQAVRFVNETKVDCLAVAIGTAHGNYPKGLTPKLDFDRLKELKKNLKIPLVLHGGSGAGFENIKKAVSLGINKINVCTDLFNYGREALRDKLNTDPEIDFMDLQHYVELEMKGYIQKYMRIIGSSGVYSYNYHSKKEVE